jgi:predicted metalloprotease
VAVQAVAGCGGPEQTIESTASSTPEDDVLQRLPEVPEATASTRLPTSSDGTGGRALPTAVFDDVQAMQRQEFEAAGVPYTPATMTVFRDEVDSSNGPCIPRLGPGAAPCYGRGR